ncbi:hypothetical protein MCAG_05517 [Micromonospora sp. ATCC 39149]|uniref:Uncharacterized protein n=1 Tax=Micromonospora carbonacea TaxID=47853 RepID=A0A7D6CGE9_9ACTN|nr:hypothetical protein [Micromonospora sp. ATCC 39149]EEP75190.1 hypothetical protein MCAG_05517 [Micromonospora sp. ATCC 39149]QLK00914.1 hypothetical protein HZU44_13540 [Micromonospora carbonacea]
MTRTTPPHAADGTEDELVRLAIRAVAPEEEPLLVFLAPAYRRRPGRWRRDPSRLVRVGGGEAGGGGFEETVAPLLPYVLVLTGIALEALRDGVREHATEAVRGGLRSLSLRWRARRARTELPSPPPLRLRPGQLLRIEEAVTAAARDPRWELTEDQVAVLRSAVRDAFAQRFGVDGGDADG